jgi:hypothetical protein
MSNDTRCKSIKPCGNRIDGMCWSVGKCRHKKLGKEEKERRKSVREGNKSGWGQGAKYHL